MATKSITMTIDKDVREGLKREVERRGRPWTLSNLNNRCLKWLIETGKIKEV